MSKVLAGWLIYKKKDAQKNRAFISKLIEEAETLTISLQLVFEEDLQYGIVKNKSVLYHPKFNLENVNFTIMRVINPLLSKQLEFMGIPCFNNSTIAEICNDKALTYQFISKLGLPTLDTYFLSYDTFHTENIPFTFPMVLKQADGRGGKEVYLVQSIEEIATKLREFPHKRFVLQEFVDNPGKDIRVFVIGTEVIGAVLRESHTSFKANYTLGGMVSPFQLNEIELAFVEKISSTLKADFIGIDFLLNKKNEPLFNEIEDVVGCRSLYSTSNVNPAALYLKYIEKFFNK